MFGFQISFKDVAAERGRRISVILRWIIMLMPMAALVGAACALFLWSLDKVTEVRFSHPWLLFLLPAGGLLVGLVYWWKGGTAEAGNNLIVDQIHEPGGGVPLRMAPLVLIATLATHLFGGSAGREGTAVQMGGSIASGFGKLFRLDTDGTRVMLMAGVAAGFAAVFGTPLAGAVFAMEVLAIGRMQYLALAPCLGCALLADWVCQSLGIHHTVYTILSPAHGLVEPLLLAKVVVAAVAFGVISFVFAEANHRLGAWIKARIGFAPLRLFIGGVAIIALVYLTGTRDYLGLGILADHPGAVTLPALFGPQTHAWSWLLKLVFTVVTLSFGFKGGEVTPLFFIGAALGNALSPILGVPVDLLAGLGFVAVFAGAANTPLACTLMGIELFGAGWGIYIAVACFVAYLCSGHSGIYLSQRIAVPKVHAPHLPGNATLRDARQKRPATPA